MKVVEDWKNQSAPGLGAAPTPSATRCTSPGRTTSSSSVLVEFMGTETMGDRLLLVETPEFETTPEMLDVSVIAAILPGMVFFRDYFLMDVQLPVARPGRDRAGDGQAGQKPSPPTLARCSTPTTGPEDRPVVGHSPGGAGRC